MVSPEDHSAFNRRVEALTGTLETCADLEAQRCARELVGLILELHGTGLKRILEIAGGQDQAVLQRLAADPVVASLFELHDVAAPAPLLQVIRSRPKEQERVLGGVLHPDADSICERCGEAVPAPHHHFVDLATRRLSCACRACWLLSGANQPTASIRRVPDRYVHGPALRVQAEQWDALQIPVSIAFFMINSTIGRTIAFYPSPAGATESTLPLTAWSEIEAANAWVRAMLPDVEALLVRRPPEPDAPCDSFIVPIDVCYDLVGRIRIHWSGFGGGDQVRLEIDRCLADIATRSRHTPVLVADGS